MPASRLFSWWLLAGKGIKPLKLKIYSETKQTVETSQLGFFFLNKEINVQFLVILIKFQCLTLAFTLAEFCPMYNLHPEAQQLKITVLKDTNMHIWFIYMAYLKSWKHQKHTEQPQETGQSVCWTADTLGPTSSSPVWTGPCHQVLLKRKCLSSELAV